MLSELFVGTLAALNIMVSPFNLPTGTTTTYKYRIQANGDVQASCLSGGTTANSQLNLQVEKPEGDFVVLHIRGHLCTRDRSSHKLGLDLNLPAAVLDTSALLRIPVDQAYIVSGIPSSLHEGKNNRLKIVREAIQGTLLPIEISWLPDGHREAEHTPIKILIDLDESALRLIPGYQAQALHWKKLSFNYLYPILKTPLNVNGELHHIEASN